MHKERFISTILAVLSCAGAVFAQQPPAKSSDYNVEIFNLDSRNHIFSIPEPPFRFSYIAHVNLKRISDWKPAVEGAAETAALRLQFWLEDGTPRIEIIAYLGKLEPNSRPSEWEKMATATVVSRSLAPDQTLTISEMEKFGIVPFQVKALRAHPWSVGPPQILNKTQALTISGLYEARPNYILNIRNVSHKAINAIRWYGSENGNQAGGSGVSGYPVIAPGASFVLRQRFGFNEERKRTDSGEWVLEREVVIAAIVFADGTFEGMPNEAAEMAANIAGDRIQRTRIGTLLGELSNDVLRDPNQLTGLKKKIAALSEEVDPEITEELITRFPTASDDMRNRRIREEVANGLRSIKNHVVREIDKLEFRLASGDVDFQLWLKDLRETFGK